MLRLFVPEELGVIVLAKQKAYPINGAGGTSTIKFHRITRTFLRFFLAVYISKPVKVFMRLLPAAATAAIPHHRVSVNRGQNILMQTLSVITSSMRCTRFGNHRFGRNEPKCDRDISPAG